MEQKKCQELHVYGEFSVKSFIDCPGARAFQKWFSEIFSKENPIISSCFNFEYIEVNGQPLLEVMAHSDDFLIVTLELFWKAYKEEEAQNEAAMASKTNFN